MHWTAHGHTAAEVIFQRADAKKGLIQRENGKRNGRWEVLIEVE
ncbi:MAG: hypothetical protein IJ836_03340 [Spirochaetales bacterium]|nr:hypothetical protein [Spirochaetales bacterium]